nr:MAG TPA: hypothetical protein [Caudoviricetes sp.]
MIKRDGEKLWLLCQLEFIITMKMALLRLGVVK